MSFLTEEQKDQLKTEGIDFINNEVMPDIITPTAERGDLPEFKDNLVYNGVLLLPDDQEAIQRIMEISAEYSGVPLKICHRKRPS